MQLVTEYLTIGAVKEVELWEARHLIPWFIITKVDYLNTPPGTQDSVHQASTPQSLLQKPLPAPTDNDLQASKSQGQIIKVKKRLIVDARELNSYFSPAHFKMDHFSSGVA